MITYPGIKIDAAGLWWFQGNEITNAGVLSYFRQGLRRQDDGRYFIHNEFAGQTESAFLDEVCGFPDFIVSIEPAGAEFLGILACGETMRFGPSDILMCDQSTLFVISPAKVPARLSRGSMTMLAPFMEEEKTTGSMYLQVGGNRYPLQAVDCGQFLQRRV